MTTLEYDPMPTRYEYACACAYAYDYDYDPHACDSMAMTLSLRPWGIEWVIEVACALRLVRSLTRGMSARHVGLYGARHSSDPTW